MITLIIFLILGWILAIIGWVFAFRLDKHWMHKYNILIQDDNDLIEKHNILAKAYNELFDVYLEFSNPNNQTPNKKRVIN